jgi:hypothetical protein
MFIIPLFLSFYGKMFDRKLDNLIWCAVAIFYVLIIGFRQEIGVDWEAYKKHYDLVVNVPLSEALLTTDPAYAFLNWVCALVGGQVYLVNFVCALLFVYGLVKFCRQQQMPWVAFLVAQPILIFIVGMGYTRQSVAVGFELLALVAISKKNNKLFIFHIIIAALFHKTAIFLLPLIAIVSNKNKFLMLVAVLIFGVGLGLVLIVEQYEALVELYVEQKLSSDGGIYRIALNIIPAVLIFIFANKKIKRVEDRNLWKSFAVLSFLLFPLINITPTATDRLVIYLIPIQLYVFSNAANWFENRTFRLLVLIGVILFYAVLMLVWLTFGSYREFWVPYRIFPISQVRLLLLN